MESYTIHEFRSLKEQNVILFVIDSLDQTRHDGFKNPLIRWYGNTLLVQRVDPCEVRKPKIRVNEGCLKKWY